VSSANRKSTICNRQLVPPRHFWPLLTAILARMAVLERKLASVARKERTL